MKANLLYTIALSATFALNVRAQNLKSKDVPASVETALSAKYPNRPSLK